MHSYYRTISTVIVSEHAVLPTRNIFNWDAVVNLVVLFIVEISFLLTLLVIIMFGTLSRGVLHCLWTVDL